MSVSVIDVSEMPDGIALSNASLDKIRAVTVKANKVITVEILTTKNTKLSEYAEVLQFMLDNNCKVEQESIKALELMEMCMTQPM